MEATTFNDRGYKLVFDKLAELKGALEWTFIG